CARYDADDYGYYYLDYW
nr:immunoglobulin heavy chain junction region [Macaca mulatta]MOX59009.1 immunoglobulin heavy chain junction region [Macaca mulatta]MOX59744.1 immunoglobulin heavy chain junction region [Macaca mulatta]MOX63408.1 immunoglobulin heavy chain junction region [Macaca mulatta]MOX63628.1 immunoglobulin heavy chain junction region [Macaca mulatta]